MNQKIIFLSYAIFYVLAWIGVIVYFAMPALIPVALFFMACALGCLLIGMRRRQMPFMSFFAGSVFGPVGLIVIPFASYDVRVTYEQAKNEEFYNDLFSRLKFVSGCGRVASLDSLFPIFPFAFFELAEYFRVRVPQSLQMSFFWFRLTDRNTVNQIILNMVSAFRREYQNKFGRDFQPAEALATDIRKATAQFA